MKLSEIRDTYSWRAAMDLSPQLLRLAEELPAAEEMGLSYQLRSLMIELPAALSADLLRDRDVQILPVLKLTTALELVDRVYPALDTAGARAAADKLADRLINGDATERSGSAAPAPRRPEPAQIPAPSSVPVLAEGDTTSAPAAPHAEAAPEATATKIQVSPEA